MGGLTGHFSVARAVSSYAHCPVNQPFHSINILIFNNKYCGHPTHGGCAEPVPQGLNVVGRIDGKGFAVTGLWTGLGQVPWEALSL